MVGASVIHRPNCIDVAGPVDRCGWKVIRAIIAVGGRAGRRSRRGGWRIKQPLEDGMIGEGAGRSSRRRWRRANCFPNIRHFAERRIRTICVDGRSCKEAVNVVCLGIRKYRPWIRVRESRVWRQN